jgi:hypothetical protein
MKASAWLALALVTEGCAIPPRPGSPGANAREAYLDAACELLADTRCQTEVVRTCDEPPSTFNSPRECKRWLTFTLSTCPGIDDGFAALAGEVEGCARELGGFNCQEDGFCDADETPVHERGACEPVAAMIDAACSDTGGGE